jgi:oligosaccharyltransferase complex subunit gamma
MRLVSSVVLVLGGGTFTFVAWPYVLPVIQSRNVWAAGSLIAILLFTSGHMYNHIRKVPYVAGDGRGGISYFAGGFQNQFGLETQIVAALCEYTSLVMHLIEAVQRLLTTYKTAFSPSAPSPSPSRSLA